MVGVGSPQEAVGTWIVVMTSLKNKLKRLDYHKVLYLTKCRRDSGFRRRTSLVQQQQQQ